MRDEALDLTDNQGIVVLADALDGSDLLERNLGNWCSTAVFFKPSNPPGQRILLSIAAMPWGDVFFARHDASGSFICAKRGGKKNKERTRPVAGPSKVKSLREASICYYGQKYKNFISVFTTGLLKKIESASSAAGHADGSDGQGSENKLRIYNLGGIPMMCNLVNHSVKTARTIDAVIELKGQKAHDFVPGAFIAMKGGAHVVDLTGKKLELEDLERLLLRPARSAQKYVIASTEALAAEIISSI